MVNNILSIALENPEGEKETLEDIFKKSPFTVLIFYRGDWWIYCRNHWKRFKEMFEDFKKYNTQIIGISADPPKINKGLIKKLELPFKILSDENHVLIKALNIPTSKKHPITKLRKYPYGFSQPAVFIFNDKGEEKFSWIHTPKLTNLYGATGRMEPEEVFKEVQKVAFN